MNYMPAPPQNYLQKALDAGFQTLVPVIPPHGTLQGNLTTSDGEHVKMPDLSAQVGKIPGEINKAGRWKPGRYHPNWKHGARSGEAKALEKLVNALGRESLDLAEVTHTTAPRMLPCLN